MIEVMAMFKKIFIILFLISLTPLNDTAFSQLADTPWPKFHHDIRNTGKTANFGTTVGKFKWKFTTGAAVTSSPVLDDNNTLYIGSEDNNFYAINRTSGALLWKYTTGGAIARTSPALDKNGVVYIGSTDGNIYAFDTKTIDIRNPTYKWKYQTAGEITSSPTIHTDGTILVGSNDGYMYAITSAGDLKWKVRLYNAIWSSPAINTETSEVYIGTARTTPKWFEMATPANAIISEDSLVQCSFIDEFSTQVFAPDFFALDINNGTEKWFFPEFCAPGGIYSSPALTPAGTLFISFFTTWQNECDDEDSKYVIWNVDPVVPNVSTITRDFPSDNSCTEYTYTLPYPTWRNGLSIANEDIYTTPAILEDNSFFIGAGADLYRGMPDSQKYYSIASVGDRIESSPAVDGQKNVFFGSNGGYFYCICADCPQTPMLWQYPSVGEEPLQTKSLGGTVTIATIISSPAIDNDERHSVYVGASDGCIYAFYDGASISGKVSLESDGSGIQGVEMTLDSTFTDQVRTTHTDSNGNYSFPGVENYSYTVTPKKVGYVFNPQQRAAVIKQDKDALNINFTAFDGFTISGKVIDSQGSPVQSVLISIEGANTKYISTATTDSNGNYSFTGLGYDTYTLVPEFNGYGFNPPSQQKTITSDATITTKVFTVNDFIAFKGYQISGMVLDVTKLESQSGIQGVNIKLTGTTTDGTTINLSKISDQEGKYSFTELLNGTYTVTPTSTEYNFEPESQNVTIASANVLNINFYAGNGFAISGKITKESTSTDNATLSSFMIELYKDNSTIFQFATSQKTPVNTVNADDEGNFIFIGVPQGSYVVKPKREGYGFDPLFYNVTIRTEPVSNLLFTAKKGLYISGKVSSIIGIGQEGIIIQIAKKSTTAGTDTALTTLTSQDGVYSFTGLDPGDYTVALPDDLKKYYQTFPESRTITLTSEGKEDINFILNSYCSTVYFNIPFFGTKGTLVNIFGINFGWSEPPDNETLTVTMGDQTQEIPSGVYFGTDDLTTWTKAKVKIWSPIKIVVEAPESSMIIPLNMVKVWVVRKNRNSEATATESDYAGCFDSKRTDFFLYLY